jgi:simple sugar transport system ATP-binding protein
MKIELKHISKRFGAVQANHDISLTFESGRIIGVLGENGAGKSTLMKILSGFQPADSGEIWLNNRLVTYRGALEAVANGIGMLQQDPLDVGAFSVLENFIFGNPTLAQQRYANVTRQARQQLSELSKRFGFDLDPDSSIEQLSIAQRQQLEIVRLLALGVKTLILDEPTTGISADQKDILFNTLKELAQNDSMTVLLISHKLEDVIALCDEVAVLRAGQVVGGMHTPFTAPQLVNLMFGELQPLLPRAHVTLGAEVLQIRGTLTSKRLHVNTAFALRAGESVGLTGLEGSGQELFLRACVGLIKPHHGFIRVLGDDVTHVPYREMMRRGVVFAATGRIEEGLIAGLTLTEHTALITEQHTRIDWSRAESRTKEGIQRYQVRGVPTNEIQQLSGGNQQRVLLSLMPATPTALILEQPTRGLDVDSARVIWAQLEAKRQSGTGIIFSSAELDEIVAYSDRILVFYDGQIVEISDVPNITVEQLGHYIGGDFSAHS